MCPYCMDLAVFGKEEACHGSCCCLCAATVPRRLASRLGPNAQVQQPQKLFVSGIKTKPSEEPSILVGLLKSIPEAIVGRSPSRVIGF